MNVFLLQHVHVLHRGAEDVNVIGIYSSEIEAKEAIDRLGQEPGFNGSVTERNR